MQMPTLSQAIKYKRQSSMKPVGWVHLFYYEDMQKVKFLIKKAHKTTGKKESFLESKI